MKRPHSASSSHAGQQRGLTLVELMVALALSLMLMAGVGTMFQANKRSFIMQDQFSRLQENGRFALNAIVRDLRGAGYLGCSSGIPKIVASTQNNNDAACQTTHKPELLFGTDCYTDIVPDRYPMVTFPVQGVEGGANPDELAIRFSDAASARVTAHAKGANQTLTLSDLAGLAQENMAVVSNCKSAAVFKIASVATGANQITPDYTTRQPDLEQTFVNGEVSRFKAHTYTISTGASGVDALFRSVDGDDPVEFIEGIENLQVLYGLDTNLNGQPNGYVTATDVDDNWPSVVSVRIWLTARSIREVDEINGGPLRQTLGATIALRNRLQ